MSDAENRKPILHIREDQMPLMLAVVAAARALNRDQFIHGNAGREFMRAVDAYEAAIGGTGA